MDQVMGKQKNTGSYIMALLYVAAGINHFVNPVFYKRIMPSWLPLHDMVIYTSGFFEVFLGILLLSPKTRVTAAWGIVILLVTVFPANIQMMLNYRQQHNPYLWVAVLRLPLQLVLIAWAYQYTKRK